MSALSGRKIKHLINMATNKSPALINTALTASRSNDIYLFNALTGSTLTLPPATGSGVTYTAIISVVATSNSHVIVCGNANDALYGVIQTTDGATVTGYIGGADIDTITLNRTTTGGTQIGEFINIVDIAPNIWMVDGQTVSTGTAATPFSDAV